MEPEVVGVVSVTVAGALVELVVWAPGWCVGHAVLIRVGPTAEVRATRRVNAARRSRRQLWLRGVPVEFERPERLDAVRIEALAVRQWPDGAVKVLSLPMRTGARCSRAWSTVPDEAWGSELVGAAFRATVAHAGEVHLLYAHWGDCTVLPPSPQQERQWTTTTSRSSAPASPGAG